TIKGEFYISPNVSIIYVDFSHQINIYPIPFTSYLKVSFHDIKIEMLDMTDASGKKVFSKSIFESDSEIELNTSKLAAGVYYLKKLNTIITFIFLGILPGNTFAQLGGYASIYGETGFFETTDTIWDSMSDLTIEGYFTPCDNEKTMNLFTLGNGLNGLQLTNH